MTASWLAGLIARTGFEVLRAPRLPRRSSSVTDAGHTTGLRIVELVGPSGVGKTEFLAYLRDSRSADDDYAFDSELANAGDLLGEADVSLSLEALRMMWAAQLQFEAKRTRTNPAFMYNQLKYLPYIFTKEACLFSTYEPGTVIIDHSLVNFGFDRLRQLHSKRRSHFEALMRNRIVVVCTTDPQLNVERITHRIEHGATLALHRGLNHRELTTRASRNRQSWLDNVQWLRSVGVPVLELDLGQPLPESKKQLIAFLRSFD